MAEKKTSIDDFKNRGNSPITAVRLDPKTHKPIKSNKSTKKGK